MEKARWTGQTALRGRLIAQSLPARIPTLNVRGRGSVLYDMNAVHARLER